MSSIYTSNGHLFRDILTRLALIVGVTVIIVCAMPKTNAPQYTTEVGKPWTQAPVTATFDFDVEKSEEALKAERDSVIQMFTPYYSLDMTVGSTQVARFISHNSKGIEGLPKSFVNSVAAKLTELYSVGIMEQSDYVRLSRDSMATIRLSNGKMTDRKYVKRLLTPMTAYETFFKDPQMANAKQQLQRCDINDFFSPNVVYDSVRSNTELDERMKGIAKVARTILNGQRIIDRGDLQTVETTRALNAYSVMLGNNLSDKSKTTTMWGRIIFVFIMISVFTIYLHLFRGDYLSKPRSLAMVYCLITLFPVLSSLMVQYNMFSVYILPMAMLPMFIRVFLDSRTAFIAHVTMVLVCALSLSQQFEFVLTEISSGLAAIYSLRELSKRSQIFSAAVITTCTALVVYYSTQLMLPGEEVKLTNTIVMHFIFSGIFLLLAYPLMFLIEKVFGFTSAVTLFELSDTNKDLLRTLSEVAPGTFQHSITVGNIAADIAQKIGARALLVRTGALYHDIGKMTNPVFFTENQVSTNPHDRMTPVESAQIITGHVAEGVRLAEKNGLPDVIRDFIITHHATGMAKFFYITEQNAHPEVEVDKKLFSYPGPNPFTREQAILMMADGVEAASRSLKEYTEESITALVNRIIDGLVADGYFLECPITFRDIDTAKKVLIEKLKTIYHTRITYPELNVPKH